VFHVRANRAGVLIGCWAMEDTVHLGDSSHYPSTQRAIDLEDDFPTEFANDQVLVSFAARTSRGGGRGRGRSTTGRSSSVSSHTDGAPPHKVRGPNWTEAEMLVLIGQKRIEWDGRHNCSQPSLAKFVYGTTAWKLVLAGCMSVVGFRARDTDQITNKWDGLIKDYKKLKEYIESSGSANWWGLSREEKKLLSKTRKMSLEFSEAMYAEMECFIGRRQIFGRASEVFDSDRLATPSPRQFGRNAVTSQEGPVIGLGSPAASMPDPSAPPSATTPGNDTPGSTGRKRKSLGTDNLVDFVKDFNHEYLARVEAQDIEKRTWRTDVLAFDSAREARISQKEVVAASMEQKLYELEVERTRNLGNMTTVLLMLAKSMDTLTRCDMPPLFGFLLLLMDVAFLDGFLSGLHVASAPNSPVSLLWPFVLRVTPAPRSQGAWVWEVGRHPPPLFVSCRTRSLQGDYNLLVFGQECGLY
jgi:hypothetical protein